jgi:hypothetical protein
MAADLADGWRERVRRLRWRLRGAWLWPTFGVVTVLDTLLLHWLPLAGDGTGWVPAFLLAGCVNIVVVAALSGIGGWWLRRRRPDLPKVVADDHAGTALVLAVALVFAGVGLAHRPSVLDQRADFSAQSSAVRRYVTAQAEPQYRARIDQADSILLEEDLYRTCVPGRDPDRWLCLLVDTSGHPATARRHASSEPNALFRAAGGFR